MSSATVGSISDLELQLDALVQAFSAKTKKQDSKGMTQLIQEHDAVIETLNAARRAPVPTAHPADSRIFPAHDAGDDEPTAAHPEDSAKDGGDAPTAPGLEDSRFPSAQDAGDDAPTAASPEAFAAPAPLTAQSWPTPTSVAEPLAVEIEEVTEDDSQAEVDLEAEGDAQQQEPGALAKQSRVVATLVERGLATKDIIAAMKGLPKEIESKPVEYVCSFLMDTTHDTDASAKLIAEMDADPDYETGAGAASPTGSPAGSPVGSPVWEPPAEPRSFVNAPLGSELRTLAV